MSKSVIILGCGPTHKECTYHTETWGVNGGYNFAKRLDKLFMTDSLEGEVLEEEYYVDTLKEFGGTLVLAKHFPVFNGLGIPIEIYPIDEIIAKFNTRFFSNTICYMMAYALYYGYEKIWFYGIDMMPNTCYLQEKGGVEFWMGVALGMGAEVINTEASATGKTWNGRMYGYWGLQEKERLLAPWEIVKAEKVPDDEWALTDDGNWIQVPYKEKVRVL